MGDGGQWPLLRAQQALLQRLPAGEAAAAEHRAQLLVERGWGAIAEWLEHPGRHPGERAAATGSTPAAADGLEDLFSAA